MRNFFSFKNDISPMLKLAFPLALTGFVQYAVWFFETIFLAKLGAPALAAGSLVSWFFATLAVIIFGILSSINILVAHKYGEQDHNGIALIARDGLWLALIVTIPTVILFWNISPIFLLLGQSDSVVVLAKTYLHALSWGLFADFIAIACLEVIMGAGHAKVILWFSVLTMLFNIVFSYLLIFGKLGFPKLGIAGAGWGITISYWSTAIVLVMFIAISKNYRNYFKYIFKFSKPVYLHELFQVGLPIGVTYCVEVSFFFALTLMMGFINSEAQAVNQVALQYLGLIMSAMFSIAQAMTVRVGHLMGARNYKAVEKANYIGIGIAIIIATIAAVFYCVFPTALISIDFDVRLASNVELINQIKIFFVACAVFQFFEAIRIILFGSLRGLKDTKFILLISIMSFWIVSLPLGGLLALPMKIGGVGFWWAMIIGAGISVVLLQMRFMSRLKRYSSLHH